jgi:hypothetical protein
MIKKLKKALKDAGYKATICHLKFRRCNDLSNFLKQKKKQEKKAENNKMMFK